MTLKRLADRGLRLTVLVGLWALASAPAAEGSCAQPPPLPQALADAEVAFVGTVVGLEHEGRTATFRVEEVWKGTLGETVVVHGGPGVAALEQAKGGQNLATSVDRTYEAATRYLVLPFSRSGDLLLDNICTRTQPYRPELAEVRPPDARPPSADGGGILDRGSGTAASSWSLLALLAAAATALGATLAWFRLRARRAG